MKPRFWIGSATHDHVKAGVEGGFCQLSHGRPEALHRMRRGDWIVYYSGREKFETKEACQKFTAIGRVNDDAPYQFTMRPGFTPWRRDVKYRRAHPADVRPLISKLRFIRDKQHWGLPFRRGYATVSEADFETIAQAMLGRPLRAASR